ncbi:hypothetical protein [Psychroserpens sp.]|uniref:hypothetical protein n=1 Tax=Psychroserpens sp. TaxID=2020870 RepID=UPI003CC50608
MTKIPNQIKYIVYGISGLIFLLLSFGLAPRLLIGMIEVLDKLTGYYFGVSTNTLDYFAFASIPICGMIYNSTRTEFKTGELLKDIITILLCVVIIFGIGLFLMIYLGSNWNPLIPKNLLIEPFNLYSTMLIVIGIALPFMILRMMKKPIRAESTTHNNV